MSPEELERLRAALANASKERSELLDAVLHRPILFSQRNDPTNFGPVDLDQLTFDLSPGQGNRAVSAPQSEAPV